MNTIPLTFNERQISHTVIDGNKNLDGIKMPVTCIVIRHGISQFKDFVFKNLLQKGFAQIISIEKKTSIDFADDFYNQFPQIKFIVTLEENVTEGDMLNLAMSQSKYKNVLVLQEEQCTQNFNFTAANAKKFIEKNVFCICPRLINASYSSINVRFSPCVEKSKFVVREENLFTEWSKTLYSADLSGFYNLDKYVALGGIDCTILSEYWQKLDLFLRAWLWGEETLLSQSLSLCYGETLVNQNKTADETYMRFYLKNLLPVFKSDHAYIPVKSFFKFNSRSPYNFVDSVNLFNDARQWVLKNQYRFKTDCAGLVANWGK